MESKQKSDYDKRQSAQSWAKYSGLSFQWILVFLLAAWAGSALDAQLATDRPYCAAVTTMMAVVWVMRSLIYSMDNQPQAPANEPEKIKSVNQTAKSPWTADGKFWLSFMLAVLASVLGIEAAIHFLLPVQRSIYYPLLVAEALPVAFMFLSVYPVRKIWPEFFNRSKVLFSLLFIGFHFLFSLLILLALLFKQEGVTTENAIPFLLFFFIFLCILFVGIFSILRPISKDT